MKSSLLLGLLVVSGSFAESPYKIWNTIDDKCQRITYLELISGQNPFGMKVSFGAPGTARTYYEFFNENNSIDAAKATYSTLMAAKVSSASVCLRIDPAETGALHFTHVMLQD